MGLRSFPLFFMENSRLLAAKQFLMNGKRLLQQSPLFQAVEQRSIKPYKTALSHAIEPGNLMPMGRMRMAQRILSPKSIQEGMRAFENDASQFRAMRHLDSAARTAERMKQALALKQRQDMMNSWSNFLNRNR